MPVQDHTRVESRTRHLRREVVGGELNRIVRAIDRFAWTAVTVQSAGAYAR